MKSMQKLKNKVTLAFHAILDNSTVNVFVIFFKLFIKRMVKN